MNVLFLTHSRLDKVAYGDGSTRYRCFNMAEVLQDKGHNADVQSLAAFNPKNITRYDVISCLRPVYGRNLQQLSNLCRARGVHLIADFDDLIFQPDMAHQSPLVVNGYAPVAQVRSQFARHERALPLFDELSVSTPALARSIQTQCPNIRVNIVRNGLSAYWLQHAERARDLKPSQMRLTYLPGSRSHDRDLQSIASSLKACLEQNPGAELSLVGKIGIEPGALPAGQVHLSPWIDYFKLPELIAQSGATLAPLVDNPFSFAKSHIKFIESAALGIPSICSPTSDLLEHQTEGLSIASDSHDWDLALQRVLQPDYLTSCRSALMDYAQEFCTARHSFEPLLQAWDTDDYWHSTQCASAA